MTCELDAMQSPTPIDLVKLIRKLRWIGLEDEADQLQAALCKFPPDVRPAVCAEPSTD